MNKAQPNLGRFYLSTSALSPARIACFAIVLSCSVTAANAQRVNVLIKVEPGASGRAFIEVSAPPARKWSFRNSYAGVSELGARIENFQTVDPADVGVRKIAPGQYEAESAVTKARYEIRLDAPGRSSDASRVSWLNAERGVLMLGDLLPEAPDLGPINVQLKMPNGWSSYSTEKRSSLDSFEVRDPTRSIFALGNHLRSLNAEASGMTLNVVVDGDWAFSDSDLVDLAVQILKAHRLAVGANSGKQASLIVLPFPRPASAAAWSAETRGSTVNLLIGKLPSKTAALALISVPLSHELFHLWIPNALDLDGSYDWFYEGFTIYQAARVSVQQGLLTFQEFLDAIARAYDAYSAIKDHDRWSLVDASQRRWTGGETVVYQKSMVIAFLYDLRLRSESNRKRSLDDVYKEIFRRYRAATETGSDARATRSRVDGNEAVLAALGDAPGMKSFVDSSLRVPVSINLADVVAPYGLRVERFGLRSRMSVNEPLTGRQRDLLRQLGYNDYVRAPNRRN